MRKIEKHSFEAVSLLTVDNGLLDITIIPAIGQPDWVVPSNLILANDEFEEYIWTYLWRNQEVAVYHLLPRGETPDRIVVLEGNTEVHRIGLLIKGDLQVKQVSISDVKDMPIPEGFVAVEGEDDEIASTAIFGSTLNNTAQINTTVQDDDSSSDTASVLTYTYQTVEIEGEQYFVPDLDTLAHHLVDLDSE